MKTQAINKQLKMLVYKGVRVLPKERLALWKQVKGLWSKRRPNPVNELSSLWIKIAR